MNGNAQKRTLGNRIAARIVPPRFLAAQLQRPSGRFGRWVMTRALNEGNAELIGSTLDALALQTTDSFLDVGFGGGRSLQEAARRTSAPLWGVDFSPDIVCEGQRSLRPLLVSGRLNLLHADVSALPLRDALIDALCTTNTIYFWPDLKAALAELRRVLAPGGRLAIGFTGREKMRQHDTITRHGFRTFMPDQLEPALCEAGFRDVKSSTLAGKVTRGDFVTSGRV